MCRRRSSGTGQNKKMKNCVAASGLLLHSLILSSSGWLRLPRASDAAFVASSCSHRLTQFMLSSVISCSAQTKTKPLRAAGGCAKGCDRVVTHFVTGPPVPRSNMKIAAQWSAELPANGRSKLVQWTPEFCSPPKLQHGVTEYALDAHSESS